MCTHFTQKVFRRTIVKIIRDGFKMFLRLVPPFLNSISGSQKKKCEVCLTCIVVGYVYYLVVAHMFSEYNVGTSRQNEVMASSALFPNNSIPFFSEKCNTQTFPFSRVVPLIRDWILRWPQGPARGAFGGEGCDCRGGTAPLPQGRMPPANLLPRGRSSEANSRPRAASRRFF